MADDPVAFRDAIRRGYDDIGDAYAAQTDGAAPLLDRFLEFLPERPRVLNAGCGPGTTAMPTLLDAARPVGLDLSATQLDLARERNPRATVVQADLTALPLPADSVDGITE